jgi:hypothetical protein
MSEHRRGSMVWAILLIGLGVLFLIGNLRPNVDAWWIFARYWPLLFIFLGLGKLWDYYQRRSSPEAAKRRWLGGGEVAIILVVALLGIALTGGRGHVRWSSGPRLHDVQSIELPGAESAKIHVDMPAGHFDLSGGAAKAVEATFDYYEHEGKPTISHEVHGSQGEVSITQDGPGGNDWTLVSFNWAASLSPTCNSTREQDKSTWISEATGRRTWMRPLTAMLGRRRSTCQATWACRSTPRAASAR